MLGVYAWFAITTAICAIYELLYPVLLEQDKVNDKIITIITFFLVSMLIAPVVFLACIIPSLGVAFRIKLSEGLFPKAT